MSDSINDNLAKNVIRLGNEVRDLAKERDALKEHIRYLEIELNCETGRWERALEENARLKAEVRDMSISNAVLRDDNEKLKAEVERLEFIHRMYTLAVQKQKAEVERLLYVGDAMAVMVGHIEVTGDAHRMMLELSKEWEAAKEGKQP